MGRAKRIWYLSPMRAAKVQASLRICAVSPEPSLLAYTSSESRGTFRQKASSLAPLNGWACAVEICHDGMLEDTNSLDGAQMIPVSVKFRFNRCILQVLKVTLVSCNSLYFIIICINNVVHYNALHTWLYFIRLWLIEKNRRTKHQLCILMHAVICIYILRQILRDE